MKYYRRRTGDRIPKAVFRIFFVICAALVITLITALIGNYLKVKIANAEAESEVFVAALPEEKTNGGDVTDFNLISMNGVGLSLGDFDDKDALVLKINSADPAADTLFLTLSGAEGEFFYSSPALSKALRQPEYEDTNGKFSLLTSAALAARAKNLTLCAVIEPTLGDAEPQEGAFVDSIIINELYELGVSRVLIKLPPLSLEEFDGLEDFHTVQTYAAALNIDGCDVGFGLDSGFVSGSDGMKLIQNLEDYAAFYAVYFDFSDGADYSVEYVTHELNSLVGLFSVYNMHVLIEDNTYSSVVYKACVSAGVDNICLEGDIPADPSGSGEANESETGVDETVDNKPSSALDGEDESKTSNPYASRADGTRDSETETETEAEPASPDWDETEPEPDETDTADVDVTDGDNGADYGYEGGVTPWS